MHFNGCFDLIRCLLHCVDPADYDGVRFAGFRLSPYLGSLDSLGGGVRTTDVRPPVRL